MESAVDLALARSVVYHAVALGLRTPGEGADGSVLGPVGQAAIRAAAGVLDVGAASGEALLPAVEVFCERSDVSAAERRSAHTRLFGHSRGLVCPFETEYGAAGAFRQPQELADIAGTYIAFGLRPIEGGDERVDHAACECEFMDFLARKEAYALDRLPAIEDEEQACEGLATIRAAARGFLREHLGRFGRAFASRLIKEDTDGFHAALGALLFEFLTQECRRLRLPPGPPALELRPPMPDETPQACGRPADELIQIQRRPRP